MRRVDSWERIAAIAVHCGKKKTTRGASYALSAYTIAAYCNSLAAMGVTLKRYDEARCNGVSEDEDARIERRLTSAHAKLGRIAKVLGVEIEHQTDPRGATIKVWADRVDGRLIACF